MPPFLASALALLARGSTVARSQLFGTPTRAALTGTAIGSLVPGFGGGIPGVDLFPDGVRRRRRRKRALTASDRADIGFLTALLGKTAGKELAIQIVTR